MSWEVVSSKPRKSSYGNAWKDVLVGVTSSLLDFNHKSRYPWIRDGRRIKKNYAKISFDLRVD